MAMVAVSSSELRVVLREQEQAKPGGALWADLPDVQADR